MAETLELGKYKKAIEKAIPEIPVENGAITLEAIWLETALPEDLIIEVLTGNDIALPANVERVVTRSGQVLLERKPKPSVDGHLGTSGALS
ncbi:MAG: hypothetical protein A2Z21_00245 [Candidatus Fraserbacteria bacterium RBG_16_55_9]|uniref:Uncharacterized protein n=1 Tax=Fraserbacteria sp. (strain RBG_16_55_9) TaxID=1817864 RepID=A0A1F5UNT0_FRAXR|nr:MAG: hypothetical protein A2Z21_00245 [Candidatus Fraserbacteria bacterium RBG_16_55_9]